ncbi:MAG: sugar kinase [Deltaproteobacteria bacterium]|nr:MAG: sugar kinase [Deltaproteobacteria bacterium]
MSARVVGIGQCCWDRIGQVASWPENDAKTQLLQLVEQGGGPVATALVVLARLGVATCFCGRIGADDEGVRIRAGLQAEKVDCSLLQQSESGRSQTALIVVEQGSGRRTIFWYRDDNLAIDINSAVQEVLSRADILLLDDLDADAALAAAQYARLCGVTTVLDGGSLRPRTREILPLIDHLVVSERFVSRWRPQAQAGEVLQELAAYGGQVAVTLGDRGCLALVDGRVHHTPAFSVPVVDTTGCGDVFHGGYVYGLLQKWPPLRILEFASACAALKATGFGGRFAPRHLDEPLAFLRSRGSDPFWRKAAD